MSAHDVAQAIYRFSDPAAREMLKSGNTKVVADLNLDDEEMQLLIEGLEPPQGVGLEAVAQLCMDPPLTDGGRAGLFFNAANYVVGTLEKDLVDFREFLAREAGEI